MLSEWDWANAEKEFKQSLYLNPNYATTHHWYAEWLLFMGRTEEAIEEIKRACELDPLSVAILKDKGMTFYYARQYDKAIDNAKKALELDPRFTPAHRLLSLAYHGKGLFSQAITENELWGNMSGNRMEEAVWLAFLYAASGRSVEALNAIESLGLEQLSNGNLFRGVALIYAELGDNDLAFKWLEKAYEARAESLSNLKVDPKMDRLRSDPRFTVLLQKVGLAE
jgi:tetratricopeptide (TPR) repeat protein